MKLSDYYTNLYQNSVQGFLSDHYQVDELLGREDDRRFGITLLLRPGVSVKRNIRRFLSRVRQLEPYQYYYPSSDIHVTIMSIISCYEGFDLDDIDVKAYVDVINRSMKRIDGINIHFRGITASSSAIMIQGFCDDNSLDDLRDELRQNFKLSGLFNSIDQRYSIFTAHATVIRFRKKLSDKDGLVRELDNFRDFDFGELRADVMELVYNDWYQRNGVVKLLHKFRF